MRQLWSSLLQTAVVLVASGSVVVMIAVSLTIGVFSQAVSSTVQIAI